MRRERSSRSSRRLTGMQASVSSPKRTRLGFDWWSRLPARVASGLERRTERQRHSRWTGKNRCAQQHPIKPVVRVRVAVIYNLVARKHAHEGAGGDVACPVLIELDT